jgi:hypothetical protein
MLRLLAPEFDRGGNHLDFWDSTDVRWMAAFGGHSGHQLGSPNIRESDSSAKSCKLN